jgi:hypothetical protein
MVKIYTDFVFGFRFSLRGSDVKSYFWMGLCLTTGRDLPAKGVWQGFIPKEALGSQTTRQFFLQLFHFVYKGSPLRCNKKL